MSEIKLTYFNTTGRAEPTRLILAQAGVAFTDLRIERESWPALKTSLPLGQLPVLEVEGATIGQSMAIARYCARRYGLAGTTDLEAAMADQAVDVVNDFVTEAVRVMYEKDEARKKELAKTLKEEKLPTWLAVMEKLLAAQGGEYFSGGGLTWADIVFFNMVTRDHIKEDASLSSYPLLAALVIKVGELPNIKNWLETRPVTE